MKYAFMSFSCPELTLDEMLLLARRLGYDGVEPRIGSGHRHGIEVDATTEARAELRRRAEESGVALCCVATSCRYADPAIIRAQIEETRRAIDLAGDVGAPRLRVFGGAIPAGVERAAAIDGVAAALREVADQAQERGVTLCLETHDDWCDPVHVAEVMRRVDHAAVAVNWDIMHPVRQGGATMDVAFDVLRAWIRHVHVHDGSTRRDKLEMVPIGTGDIDHRRALELLHQAGYDGYLSGEWINWEPYETHLPRELQALKGIEAEIVR